ncbi:MAG: N-6 DNA methylase, partial [Bacteroidetes bacterium]|nr:N-6 DNA methylase [Bacteroidota bacterium]
MIEFKANERTFQGVLLSTFNSLLQDNPEIKFDSAFQELNVGVGESRFSDTIITSNVDSKLKVFIELKNQSWDATDEDLVNDAMMKAFKNGIEYFITGTPRQLVLFKTFEPNTTPQDRKLKLYYLANVKSDNDVTTPAYQSQIQPTVKIFLQDLSNLIHGITDVHWDSIDKQFINKLSTYILEASAQMSEEMTPVIQSNDNLKKRIRDYIQEQDIFHVTINFRNDDIYNLCQLSNYLLYLKIIFYSYLQRDVKKLNLKPLTIPEEKHLLNKALRERFNDVLAHDYEPIFKETVLDEFTYPQKYLPELRRNVKQIGKLQFQDLSCDIIGSIYNTLIENQEQHDRGQHFTNTNEVDIVNAFCINKETKTVLDSGCGAGTFLVRAYAFMKHFNKKAKHIELLERLWGIDIAPFPVFLASMNLSLLDIKEID